MEWWWTYKPPDNISVLWRTINSVRDVSGLDWVVPDAANHSILFFNNLGIPQKNNFIRLENNFSPAGVCQSSNQSLWISDWKSGIVESRSIFGHKLCRIEGLCSAPADLCVTRQNELLVIDLQSNQILRLDSSGYLMNQISLSEIYAPISQDLREFLPSYIDCSAVNNMIVVSDSDNSKVVLLEPSGKFHKFLSGTIFDQPYGVKFNNRGEIFVADYSNQRIAKFDVNGRYIQDVVSWNHMKPDEDGYSWTPRSLAINDQQDISVVSCTKLYHDNINQFRFQNKATIRR